MRMLLCHYEIITLLVTYTVQPIQDVSIHCSGYKTHPFNTHLHSAANTTPTCTAQLIRHTYTAQPTKVPVPILLTADDVVLVTVIAFFLEVCLTDKCELGTISGR